MLAQSKERKRRDAAHLRREALEERGGALVADKLGKDGAAGHVRLEVRVLDAGLDGVEGGGDGDGGDRAGDGCDEVLAPGGLRVVLDTEDVVLGEGGSTEELKNV